MNNALVKLDFDKEQMAVIENQLFPQGTSKAEQAYCLAVARELCLNPITKEIFFVKRRQKIGDTWITKVEPMVGRDGFLSIAHRSKQLAGIETTAGIREVPQLENGQWGFKNQLVTECTVWRKDSSKPFTAQVSYNEYCQKNSEGFPTKFWAEKPETMLKKVAESQALRKAFNIHGVYCPEELGAGFELASGDIVIQATESDTRPENDKSHLTLVKTPETETAVKQQTPAQPAPKADGQAEPREHPEVVAADARKIIQLLESMSIPYVVSINGLDGAISAKSFNEKDLLKSNGFKWAADQKRWIFKFKNEPF